MTNEELTEYLFKRGLMPRWAYYQLNGKSAAENYRDQYNRRQERDRADRELEEYKARRKAEIEAELEKEVEEKLAPTVEDALNNLLKDWQYRPVDSPTSDFISMGYKKKKRGL